MKRWLILTVLAVSAGALADRTVTLLSASSTVDTITFTYQGTDIAATVCGHTDLQGGGSSPQSCYAQMLSGQFKTDVATLRTARAIPFWKGQEGL